MNLSNYIPETYIPATITASVALIAAVGAQFVNNWLTHRRENKKYLRAVYEEFISEFFADVITYAYASSSSGKGYNIKEEVDISSVLNNMFKKVHYGDKDLQSLHLEYKTWKYMDDVRADTEVIIQLKICYFFLLYCRKVFKKIGFDLKSDATHALFYNIKLFAYLYICSESRDYEKAVNSMNTITMFKVSILENYSLRYLHKLVMSLEPEKSEKFLNEVDEKLENYVYNSY
ncbi:hypothetical protein [Pseudobacillus badius]|uniref:hypothetical protein n=1 Tax=Bacillus badius TaxID=1455 RepID=UPI001CBDFA8D|nr:hypothetical protein [Bacillus badius]UAT28941.1 hypothetical protein K7T73_09855 [Bacillus badius]GLY12677.1 hypothetical protein Bbad01_38930 [Bacillus badius]